MAWCPATACHEVAVTENGFPAREPAVAQRRSHGGMPDARLWRGSGRTRYREPGRGSRFASQPAGRACPLPSAPDSVPALIDTSETMEGGTST
jgi:hypothetical protein